MFNLKEKLLTTKNAVLVGLVVGGLLLLNKKQPNIVEEIPVTSPVVVETVQPTDVISKTMKVKSLNPDPEQVIILNTEVNYIAVEILIEKIEKLSKEWKDIYLILDSPGGSVFDGARLISYMEASKANVHTVSYGMCASMCAQIFSHGKTRNMINRSVLMFHPASGGVRGPVPGMISLLNFIDKEVKRLDAYVADRAGIDRKEFELLVLKDLWISAEDAINMKLADNLVVIPFTRESEDIFIMSEEFKRRKIKIIPKNNKLQALDFQ